MVDGTLPANAAARQQALDAIASFEQSALPGLWPHLNKATVTTELRSRVMDPFQINQGQQPFCGPASVVFELVRRYPLRYVQLCRSLFELGTVQTRTKKIVASHQLRQSSKGNLRMGQADWMLMATLRESENSLFPVDPGAPEIIRNISGMTKSWELKGWVEELLNFKSVIYRHTYLMGDMSALSEAASAIAAGGAAFALITAEGLLGKSVASKTDLPAAFPNHWITLLGNISVQKGTFGQHDSGRVGFDAYTWAQKRRIEATEGPFERFFWGVVIARP